MSITWIVNTGKGHSLGYKLVLYNYLFISSNATGMYTWLKQDQLYICIYSYASTAPELELRRPT